MKSFLWLGGFALLVACGTSGPGGMLGGASGGAMSGLGGNSTGLGGSLSGGASGTGGLVSGLGGGPALGGGANVGGSSSGGVDSGIGGGANGGLPEAGGGPGSSGGMSNGAGGSSGGSLTATEWTSSIKLGWNLGNTLDAPEGETAWGNPIVTPALMTAVKQAGFSAVRIPVTWSLHTGAGPSFTIDPTFMARVAEVVGYAKDAGLRSIINIHHDGADEFDGVEWLTLNDEQGNVTTQNNAAVEARFLAVWTQIATHFRDYDSTLAFESMNEIHDGYDAPDPAYYDIINQLNQKFVDLVRGTGGNNTERCLVVPGYNTNIDYTLAGFELPSDSTPDRLILSVHYYDPWSYAGEASTQTWGAASPNTDTWGQEDFVVGQYDKLVSKFVNQGVPMIVGEYGAVHQTGYEDYRRYYMEYVTKVIVDRKIVPFYWDNGSTGSGMDGFGLIGRSDGSSLHPEILAAMVRAATDTYELADVELPQP
jgi:endoglucanase